MKFLFVLTLFVWSVTLCKAQTFVSEGSKQIFSSPHLPQQIRKHHAVAILPVTAKVNYAKPPKGFNRQAHFMLEVELGNNVQQRLYTFLVRKAKLYTVTFQNVEQTNAILQKAGMYDHLKDFSPAEIAQVLGVDAVLTGQFELDQNQPNLEAGTTAVTLKDIPGNSALGTLTLMLHSGTTGELLWRFFKIMDDDFTSANPEIIQRLMRKVSRNLPYSI
ncbi:hypothetical protein HUW51_19910 [Adhaeribacter swui]|uniref:DUF4136 domain-containing protein n=1 Tax=Adhaeribacter swui TaxID=2086471 RepID=A0A7G7GCJ4_9BACT|nr:hypothetical protein [Adhaeribacter swui]QNF34878.1 hypothetical protein HUW51_19910 [Adhaeribacter swui]